MEIIWFLLIGLCAGWLAGQILKGSSFGMTGNLIVGVIGAIVGGLLVRLLGLAPTGLWGQLLCATGGAIVFILALAAFQRRRV